MRCKVDKNDGVSTERPSQTIQEFPGVYEPKTEARERERETQTEPR